MYQYPTLGTKYITTAMEGAHSDGREHTHRWSDMQDGVPITEDIRVDGSAACVWCKFTP